MPYALEQSAKIYQVSELNAQIRSLLEAQFGSVWMTGEISNFKAHSSGHYYFSLKDAEGQISAVMYRGSHRFLKFKIEDGLAVLVNGRVTLYEPRGSYQIVVEYLEPQGLGALQLAFQQLKKKLEGLGLFDPSQKKPIPFLPKRVGIVTSPTGAAIRDLLQVLRRRYPNISVLLYPVNVQGEGACHEIAQAIDELNALSDIDVMIVGRGGGSLEDLWAFNTEVVALAIARSKIPIISAVGHEIDITISDFVADLRAPTPSAAAELAVRVKQELWEKIRDEQEDLARAMQRKIKNLREGLLFYKNHLKHPRQRLSEHRQHLGELQTRLRLAIRHRLLQLESRAELLKNTLWALSPRAVLNRGYSITCKKDSSPLGRVPLKNISEVDLNDELEIWLAEGRLEGRVIKKIN